MPQQPLELVSVKYSDAKGEGPEKTVKTNCIDIYGITIPFILDKENQTLTLDMTNITDDDLDRIGIALLQVNPDGSPDSDYETYSLEELKQMLQEGRLVFDLTEIFQTLGTNFAGIIYIISKMKRLHTTFFAKNNE